MSLRLQAGISGVFLGVLVTVGLAAARPGDLDRTFSGDGKVMTNITSRADIAYSVALQPNDKIVVAGVAGLGGRNPKFALARYKSDGSLDTTFSGDGQVVTDITSRADIAYDVAVQLDGKIVVAGGAGLGGRNATFAVARYNSNGRLDTRFSGDGKLRTNFAAGRDVAYGVALRPSGKIVAAGVSGYGANAKFALARYAMDGDRDPTFGGDGRVKTDFTSNADVAYDLGIDPNGKIVVAGVSGLGGVNTRFALARYKGDGSLDDGFSDNGMLATDFTAGRDAAYGVAIQPNGMIVAAGGSDVGTPQVTFALARYRGGGRLDRGFNGDGKVTTQLPYSVNGASAFDVAIQANGTIVAVGGEGLRNAFRGPNVRFALARYQTDGSLEITTESYFVYPDHSVAYAITIQYDGKIVAAGLCGAENTFGTPCPNGEFGLVRFLAN